MTKKRDYKTEIENDSRVEDLFNPRQFEAKPFLKWAGGKTQLLPLFKNLYPSDLKQKKIKTITNRFSEVVLCSLI